MHIPENWWVFILLGLAAGLLSGSIGVGAGIIMVPVMSMMAYGQKEAQGVALAVMVPMALMGAIRYKLNPEIKINDFAIIMIAIGGVAGAFFGAQIAASLPANLLRKIFAGFLVIAAVKMFTMK